ncbi:MAG: Flp pilus assembly protein CpaB [Dehalococcoidia bacterium]
MRTRSLLLSLIFAVVGGGLTLLVLRGHTVSQAPQADATERVVVPVRPIAVGDKLGVADVRTAVLMKGTAPEDSLRDPAEVQGQFAQVPLVVGQPLRRADMSSAAPGSRLAAIIPDGHIAIAVGVSDVISTGGFVAPGDHVDVLGVVTKEAQDSAQVVLQDVLVLAVSNALNGTADPAASTRKPAAGGENPNGVHSTITLAVTTQEAQRLVQVDELGKLRFALRRRIDGGTGPAAASR